MVFLRSGITAHQLEMLFLACSLGPSTTEPLEVLTEDCDGDGCSIRLPLMMMTVSISLQSNSHLRKSLGKYLQKQPPPPKHSCRTGLLIHLVV